jgi:hypothetical protein
VIIDLSLPFFNLEKAMRTSGSSPDYIGVICIVKYIVVSGDAIEGGFPPYLRQFFKEETIPIFTAIRDKLTSVDCKGITSLRYLLHDGHECPQPLWLSERTANRKESEWISLPLTCRAGP